jgi:hypothetical protein
MRALIPGMLALAITLTGAEAQRKGLPKKSSAEEKSCVDLCYARERPGCEEGISTCCFPANLASADTLYYCRVQCIWTCNSRRR